MKIGAIIPTRGDRKIFLDYAVKQIKQQTKTVDEIIIVNDAPLSPRKDITWRYKIGFKRAIEKGCNLMFFWEDDDWYDPTYVQWMYDSWVSSNRPMLFGIGETYYYHIGIDKCHHMDHPGRASAFCTAVTPDIARFMWPRDDEPFLDLKLWRAFRGTSVKFKNKVVAVGIKHGIGLTGGGGHEKNFRFYNGPDSSKWFTETVDENSRQFYKNIIATYKK